MPRFPIVRSEKEVATPSQARSNVDVGAIGRAISKLGEVTTQQAIKWDTLHAQTQFSNSKRIASDRMGRELAEELSLERDPEKYEQIYNKALEDVKRARPGHKEAGRMYDLWLNGASPQWNKGMFATYQQRLLKNERESQAAQKAERKRLLAVEMVSIAREKGSWAEAEKEIVTPEFQEKWLNLGITPEELGSELVRTKAKDAIRENAEKEQFKKDQAKVVADLSKATVKRQAGIDDLDDALDKSYITASEYRTNVNLRSAGTAKSSDLVARANVLRAIQSKNSKSITEGAALKILYDNSTKLTAGDNSKFQEDIISVGDPSKSRSFTRAQSLMTDIIRDKDPLSGFFTDDEDQIVGDAQGTIQLNDDIATAAKTGKPMTENEMIIRSIEIGQQIKRDIKTRKDQPTTRKIQGRTLGIRREIEEAIPKSELKKAPDLRLIPTPDGFENVWPKLGSSDREDVLKELETGTDPNEIIIHLERKLSE